ncbi:TetR/AcrR family transcriptional regulator [Pacificoceanicola onchidii]|uniref:TetR/AcrR family transcriptional regulator n=1 Tax=Pacificoceanicola onchidii TaxID=2562685 RepID=UPI0010A64F07|nr:TetR/AcrR family transcriptional regulator [Pacificoceanicola onchidii]
MARTIAKDHEEKRGHIMTCAAKIFATLGYHKASMTLLAQECGMSKANLYHYYDSKDAILFDLLDLYLFNLRNRILILDLRGMSSEAQFRHVVREILLAYEGQDDQHKVQMNALESLPKDQQEHLRNYQRSLVGFMSQIIAYAGPESLSDDLNRLRGVTMSVFGMLNWFHMWNAKANQQEREEYATLVCDLTLKGLNEM